MRSEQLQEYFSGIATEPIVFCGPNFQKLMECDEEFSSLLHSAGYQINAKRRAYTHVLKKGMKMKKKQEREIVKTQKQKQKNLEKRYETTIQNNYEIKLPSKNSDEALSNSW
eukprot:TRINITY_DN6463_c0_g1_i1.p1 TRINITY_DN6463_c0_g1~~TRINITY_DN6463_c0_g1_i1.p1  ORF type:complete len:112 (-),score=20.60 TRINITY_DN6463_c0_g1_i1:218-553(-)